MKNFLFHLTLKHIHFFLSLLNLLFYHQRNLLTFDCMDSIDLRINAMAELYRKATYDYQNHRELLPANLRKFRMWIIVTEIRQIDLQKNLGDVLNPFNSKRNASVSNLFSSS